MKKAVLIISTLVALLAVSPSMANAAINIYRPDSKNVVPETADFPSVRFIDRWDMSQWTDPAYSQYYENIADFKIKDGMLSGRTTAPPYFHVLFPGYRDGVPMGRDGETNRIDTSKYKAFSVRMYASKGTQGQVLWLYDTMWTQYGVKGFRIYPGWHTYDIDLSAHPNWTGRPMGLRMSPASADNVSFKVDWVRLYQKSSRRVALSWTDTKPGSTASVYLDRDQTYGNNPVELLESKTSGRDNTYYWNPSPHAPGTYFLYVKNAGEAAVYSQAIVVNGAPLIKLTNPDEAGGKDYATVENGDPWDMNAINDITFWDYLENIRFANGIMSAKAIMKYAGQEIGEGFMHMRVTKPIDTNKYHRLTIRYRYDGPFDFGLGTMARVIWGPDHYDLTRHSTSDAIITYPQWRNYTISLKKMPVVDNGAGWTGLVRTFRFDPLEVPRPWTFYVDYIRLRADDEANRSFTISWNQRPAPRPAKVSIFYDTNRTGYDGKRIVTGLKSVAGTNRFVWNTSRVPAGKYWVYVKSWDGISVSKTYSTGPVVISH